MKIIVPKSYGYAYNTKAAKELKKELEKSTGRKAHYRKVLRLGDAYYRGQSLYFGWVEPKISVIPDQSSEVKTSE